MGNAVPPILAKEIAKSIINHAKSANFKIKEFTSNFCHIDLNKLLNRKIKSKYNFIDLFSGAGDLQLVFKEHKCMV